MPRLLPAAFAVILLAHLSAAQDAPAVPVAGPDGLAAADRFNRLSLSLFTAAKQARPGNLVISSWPTQRSLTLAHLGAAGDTRKEIAKILGTDDPINDQIAVLKDIDPGIAAWNREAAGRAEFARLDQVEWGTLSAVWLDRRVNARTAYLGETRRMHGTLVRGIDLQNSGQAVQDVNQWVAQVTQNRIPRLLDAAAFGPETRLALTSATFFKAPWQHGSDFKVENTRREPFRIQGGAPEPVLTMVRKGTIGSAVHAGFTAVGLRTEGEFQLLVLVPHETMSLAALEDKLTPELLRASARLKPSKIELHLPKFRVAATTLAVRAPLEALGMRLAFDRNRADFSALSATPMWVEDIFDAAEFRIDEKGLSGAAASTVAAAGLGGDLPTLRPDTIFRVDRPFVFALQHLGTGLCVFVGKVTDPR